MRPTSGADLSENSLIIKGLIELRGGAGGGFDANTPG